MEEYYRFLNKDGKLVFCETDEDLGKGIRSYFDFIKDLRQTRIDASEAGWADGQKVVAPNYELIAEVEEVLVDAVIKLSFGEALKELMSKRFLGKTMDDLQFETGLDRKTISNMWSNESVTRENILRACFGLNLPPAVSSLLLAKGGRFIDPVISTKEEKVCLQFLTNKWFHRYEDVFNSLKDLNLEHLLKKPRKPKN